MIFEMLCAKPVVSCFSNGHGKNIRSGDMTRLGARIRKGTMETMKTLGTAAVARSPMSPVTNVAKAFSVTGVLQSPTSKCGLEKGF